MSMTAEHGKLRMAILRQEDAGALRVIALSLLGTVCLATARDKTKSYRVVRQDGWELEEGSKEFCIGYATHYGDGAKVLCGDFEVFPNWGEIETKDNAT
jgi:hypothetical protein